MSIKIIGPGELKTASALGLRVPETAPEIPFSAEERFDRPEEPVHHRPDHRVVGEDHHQDQHHRVDQHPVIRELTQHFRQDGQEGGGDDGAEHVAQAAQHHEDQHVDTLVEGELGRNDG